MENIAWIEMFETAVEDGIMESPGVDGLHGLLELNELHVALIDVQSVFDKKTLGL